MTTWHLTHNLGDGKGSVTLCGASKARTYRTMAEGTADHFTDRFFARRVIGEPNVCDACLARHAEMPPAQLPALLR